MLSFVAVWVWVPLVALAAGAVGWALGRAGAGSSAPAVDEHQVRELSQARAALSRHESRINELLSIRARDLDELTSARLQVVAFDEVHARLRASEAEVARLRAQLAAPTDHDAGAAEPAPPEPATAAESVPAAESVVADEFAVAPMAAAADPDMTVGPDEVAVGTWREMAALDVEPGSEVLDRSEVAEVVAELRGGEVTAGADGVDGGAA